MSDINAVTGFGLTVGELAVKHTLITVTDLEKAMRICADLPNSHDAIPEYLVAQNLIQQKDCDRLFSLARAMAARGQDIKFGTIAIQKGFITESMLELALDEQATLFKKNKKYALLGNILVEAGMLTSQQRDIILSEQNRYHFSSGEQYAGGAAQSSGTIAGFPNSTNAGDTYTTGQNTTQSLKGEPYQKRFAQSEIFPSGIRLIIKGDGNAAYMFKTEQFSKEMSIGQIKELLASRNIIHGIVENSLIHKFIDSDIYLTKPFKIAQGNAPIEGQNAAIQYFFTKNRLKAGTIREDGTIDFRERGNIPQVDKGAVLAIKRSAVEGQVGKNIFNDTIRVMPTRDTKLKAGKGTLLTTDKLKVIAAVSGHPKLGSDATIYVYDTFVVQGDVDFKTGNIDYQGDVTVRGCINNGFKVKGNNIRAEEVDGATVIAQGNIIVEKGINESRISSQGSLSAKFIQKSIISCVGDITTKKEVVDSTIECSGTCHVNGVIVYSKIAAKMGLYAKQIGKEKASGSTILVGRDIFALKELEKLEQDIEDKKEIKQRAGETIALLQEELETAEEKILRLTLIKEQHEEGRMDILSTISSMDSRTDNAKAKHMQSELTRVMKKSGETSRKLAICHDNIMAIRQTISETRQQIKENGIQIESLLDEKDSLIEWMKKNPGIAIIKVEDQIMAGTHVYGKYSEDIIKSSVNAVVIREDQVSRSGRDIWGRENEACLWKMYITKI